MGSIKCIECGEFVSEDVYMCKCGCAVLCSKIAYEDYELSDKLKKELGKKWHTVIQKASVDDIKVDFDSIVTLRRIDRPNWEPRIVSGSDDVLGSRILSLRLYDLFQPWGDNETYQIIDIKEEEFDYGKYVRRNDVYREISEKAAGANNSARWHGNGMYQAKGKGKKW